MRFRALLPLILLELCLATLFAACQSEEIPPELENPARVSGSITYVQRVALPDDALVRVSLFDIAHPGATATLVNEQTITSPGQVPIPFEIWYRRDTIDVHHIYALQARIEAGGRTWFENKEPVPVITNGALRQVQIIVDMSSP